MCTDKNHGGRRCPADNSDSRRMRRKAATLRNSLSSKAPASGVHLPAATSLETIEDFKNHAEELKAKVYGTPPEGQSQYDYDAEVEVEITAFGVALGEHAEELAGFDKEEMRKAIRELEEEIYSEASAKIDETDEIANKTFKAWRDGLRETGFVENWKALNELTDEEKKDLTPEQLAAGRAHVIAKKNFDKALEAHRALDSEYNSRRNDMFIDANQKLTAAYQDIISQIRPVGGEVAVSEDSEGPAIGLLGETVTQHYPASWLDAHNELSKDDEVVFKITTGRPNYSPTTLSDTEDDGIPKTTNSHPMLIIPPKAKEQMAKLFGSPQKFVMSIWTGDEMEVSLFRVNKDEVYDSAKHGVGANSSTPPEGQGWEFRPTLETASSPEAASLETDDQVLKFFTQKRWVRTETSTKKRVKTMHIFDKEGAQSLQINGAPIPEYGKAVAYHEFAHRMEEVLPDNVLPRQEKAFLARRSKKNLSSTDYGQLIQLSMAGEFAHDGRFVTSYVGREYFHNKNYEVFSTGIEAIYGGEYGGLVGNSATAIKYDADHRGFTLGILATL